MAKTTYKGYGKTPKEAFESIWSLMQFTDDFCLRMEDGGYRMKIIVQIPTNKERVDFEIKNNNC